MYKEVLANASLQARPRRRSQLFQEHAEVLPAGCNERVLQSSTTEFGVPHLHVKVRHPSQEIEGSLDGHDARLQQWAGARAPPPEDPTSFQTTHQWHAAKTGRRISLIAQFAERVVRTVGRKTGQSQCHIFKEHHTGQLLIRNAKDTISSSRPKIHSRSIHPTSRKNRSNNFYVLGEGE